MKILNFIFPFIFPSKYQEIADDKANISKLLIKNKEFQIKIKKLIKIINPDPKKIYYNQKYPFQNISYLRTERGINYQIDVRDFLMSSFELPNIIGTDDEKAYKSLIWVLNNLQYVTDPIQYHTPEYWAFPYETMKSKKGDCEDGAILLASIMLKNKIPSWKIRLSAGFVFNPFTKQKEGHAYVTYYVEEKNKWVVLDWSFLPSRDQLKDRPAYKDMSNYGKIWFSFNNKFSWGKDEDLRKTNAKKILNKK